MVSKLFNGFKLIIGSSFTILGGLTFFFTGSLLNKLHPMLENPKNPIGYQETITYITTFKEAHSYSIILIIIGILISLHAIIKLFQADFEAVGKNTIH